MAFCKSACSLNNYTQYDMYRLCKLCIVSIQTLSPQFYDSRFTINVLGIFYAFDFRT